MQAATRRNLALAALGIILLFALWQVPGRNARSGAATPAIPLNTPQPTPTPETQWRVLQTIQGDGPHNYCADGQTITVPGPWRVRATPTDRTVQVDIYDQNGSHLYAHVWASGPDHGALATLPQGNGTFCLHVQADGPYTLYVEAWEAPQR